VSSAAAKAVDTFASNRAVSRVKLEVAMHAGVTRRARVHEAGSLRVRCPGSPAAELEAVLVNTGGGVAGGDHCEIDVRVGSDANLVVTTAAAEKVYRTLAPAATITVKLAVEPGGALAWLPQETILFDRSRLDRSIAIDLAEDARLVLAEAVLFGRSGMGEALHEGALFDRWRLRRGGRLVHAEAVRLEGAVETKLRETAVAKGGVAIATVLLVPGDESAVTAIRALGETFRGEVGASAWNGIAVARLAAADGAVLRHDLVKVLSVVRAAPLPRLWSN
jgi:urease accessory protein